MSDRIFEVMSDRNFEDVKDEIMMVLLEKILQVNKKEGIYASFNYSGHKNRLLISIDRYPTATELVEHTLIFAGFEYANEDNATNFIKFCDEVLKELKKLL